MGNVISKALPDINIKFKFNCCISGQVDIDELDSGEVFSIQNDR